MEKAKVFWSGRSQAVRLPKHFRFDTAEVTIRKQGDMVILEPIKNEWEWLDKYRDHGFDDAFVAATEEHPGEQKRPELDIFK